MKKLTVYYILAIVLTLVAFGLLLAGETNKATFFMVLAVSYDVLIAKMEIIATLNPKEKP